MTMTPTSGRARGLAAADMHASAQLDAHLAASCKGFGKRKGREEGGGAPT